MSSHSNHTLICLHGNSSSKKVFSSQEKHFEKLIAEDLPGHGDQPSSDDPDNDYAIDTLRRLLIQKYEKLEPSVLLGNSLGGHLAVEIAPDLPGLKALIIFGTPPLKKPLNVQEAFLPTEAFASFFQGAYDEEALRKIISTITQKQSNADLLIADFIRTDPSFRDVWARECMEKLALLDEVEIVKNLTVPVFVIQGKEDPSVNLDYVKGLEGIAKVYEIDDCGHYPTLEQPEKFNAIVEEVLKDL